MKVRCGKGIKSAGGILGTVLGEMMEDGGGTLER